jgi:hypothetical protein
VFQESIKRKENGLKYTKRLLFINLPEYISKKEVKRIYQEIGLRDWTEIEKPEVTEKEASAILESVNEQKMNISLEDFKQGLEVELEHGTLYNDTNVTNNHPILTGKIVLAHLK